MTLDIYIHTGQCGIYASYSKGICNLTYSNIKIQKSDDGTYSIHDFPVWDIIQVEIKDEVKINDDEFYEVEIVSESWNYFCVLKSDIEKLKDFCNKRNQKMLLDRENVYHYLDDNVFSMAENLINLIEEDVMLNYRVVARLHIKYSHKESKIFKRNFRVIDEYKYRYRFSKSTYGLKGKEKKDAERYDNELQKKFLELVKIIDNFVEIITDENKINEYIAKAVAWEAIQRKAIDYYSQQWIEEYENILDNTFDELYINLDNQNIDKAMRDYIKSVLLCNEIDIEHSQEILMYFLLSKLNIDELILCDRLVEHYEIIKELKQSIDSSDIKQKLRTKQKRKITKYTIDDIDLMTGAEFEEFIALLFKKMGYSSQVTKQSGDQGLDVIAGKNGIK